MLLVSLVALCCLALLLGVMVILLYFSVRAQLRLIQEDVGMIRMRTVPVAVGGRVPPSYAELQAAAARNRVDPGGVAHPGGPN